MSRLDPHSYYDDSQPRTRRWQLDLRVDFAKQVLDGRVTLELEQPSGRVLDLDSKGLTIHEVRTQNQAPQCHSRWARKRRSWDGGCACSCRRRRRRSA